MYQRLPKDDFGIAMIINTLKRLYEEA